MNGTGSFVELLYATQITTNHVAVLITRTEPSFKTGQKELNWFE
jgi:hypothetical protein